MINKQKNFVSAIVYLFEAEELIKDFLNRLHNVLNDNFEKFEIILVNDASTDKSKEIIKEFANKANNCMLSILNMSYYQGVESAMCAGVDLAIGDFVYEFDSTIMDYDPNLIIQAYERALTGYDIVSCGNGSNRISSKLFYAIYNRNSSAQYNLKSETFRIISRRGLNRIHSMSVNIPYRKSLYSNCGLKTDHIHYTPSITTSPKKQALKNPIDTAVTSLILFTDVFYKASLLFTFIMMLATLASISYVIYVYLTGNPVAGYTTMMILISGAFFALFAIMAIVIKYLSVILLLVFRKQKYLIESIEKIVG